MKSSLFLICLLMPYTLRCAEAKADGETVKETRTELSRIVHANGTSERILTTTDSENRLLKTTITFEKDGKTLKHYRAHATTDIPTLLYLIGIQNLHHAQLVVSSLGKLSTSKELNAAAVLNYTTLTGSASTPDDPKVWEYTKEILKKT